MEKIILDTNKIFVLNCSFMNGTVTTTNDIALFTDRSVAEKTRDKVKELNKDTRVYTEITELPIYTNESEVPILNLNKNTDIQNG